MKKKSKKAKYKKIKEFRYHTVDIVKDGKKTKLRHPTYIFLEKGDLFIYVTITHSNDVNGYLVIELRKNPNPNQNTPSYYVADIREDTKDRFGRREDDWKIDLLDDDDIRKWFYSTKKDDSVDRD